MFYAYAVLHRSGIMEICKNNYSATTFKVKHGFACNLVSQRFMVCFIGRVFRNAIKQGRKHKYG